MPRIALVLFILLVSVPARADLMADARALVTAWSKPATTARVVTTVFVHDGETRRVPYADRRNKERRCLTIVAIAERHVRFTLSTAAAIEPQQSRAGVARLVDCGGGALSLDADKRRVEVSIARGRGAVEIISATYAKPLPSIEVVLPTRAVGPVGTDEASAGALPLAPQAARLARARRGDQLDGASTITPVSLSASDTGSGAVLLELESGCHRVHVLADAKVGVAADVDAEARRNDDGVLLRRDRSHAPDARLAFCLGEAETVEIRFAGAPEGAKVSILTAHWPIPEGVPSTWGAEAQAGLAWALHRRRAPSPKRAPIFQSLGAPGTTVLPVQIEPNACYLSAFSLARGVANAGRLTAIVGHQVLYDDASDLTRSSAVTFCAGPHDTHARLLVDVRSRDAWWVTALWRIGGGG